MCLCVPTFCVMGPGDERHPEEVPPAQLEDGWGRRSELRLGSEGARTSHRTSGVLHRASRKGMPLLAVVRFRN